MDRFGDHTEFRIATYEAWIEGDVIAFRGVDDTLDLSPELTEVDIEYADVARATRDLAGGERAGLASHRPHPTQRRRGCTSRRTASLTHGAVSEAAAASTAAAFSRQSRPLVWRPARNRSNLCGW
jgi:hypothetical protein